MKRTRKGSIPRKRVRQVIREIAEVPEPKTVEDLFNSHNNLLRGSYHTEKYLGILRHRQKRSESLIQELLLVEKGVLSTYKVPLGVKVALRTPLIHCQVVNRYPWAVVWVTKSGKRKHKLQPTLVSAVLFHARAQKINATATIISRQRHYDIPSVLRGRIPKGWSWCPRCMKPRKYKRVTPQQDFTVIKKSWSEEKQRWVFKERRVYLLECRTCGCTNRDPAYRRSNQPWEVRKIKRGKTRVKAHHHTSGRRPKKVRRKR